MTDEPRHARDRTWPRAAKRNILVTALAVALLTIGASAYAQETTGSVTGIIVDAQGLPVPGVTVTVTGPQGAKNAVTEATGRFSVPFLVPGTYSVRSELQGFTPVERRNVNVGLGQTVELNLKMEVGGVAETVQVSSGSPVIDTSTTY